jgi:hypothetical protein
MSSAANALGECPYAQIPRPVGVNGWHIGSGRTETQLPAISEMKTVNGASKIRCEKRYEQSDAGTKTFRDRRRSKFTFASPR